MITYEILFLPKDLRMYGYCHMKIVFSVRLISSAGIMSALLTGDEAAPWLFELIPAK